MEALTLAYVMLFVAAGLGGAAAGYAARAFIHRTIAQRWTADLAEIAGLRGDLEPRRGG